MWLFTGTKVYWPGNLDSYTALFGFLRLRIDPEPGGDFVPEIQGCGLIREVHVYGTSLGVGKDAMGSQHRGYGQLLVNQAEKICADHGLTKTAVIAGIGVREYYKNKCGYTKGQAYMLKNISQKNTSEFPMRIMFILFAVLYKLTTFNIVPFDYKYPNV
jgi:histone acetyltransferase (RNA polymerase elongator complex component)